MAELLDAWVGGHRNKWRKADNGVALRTKPVIDIVDPTVQKERRRTLIHRAYTLHRLRQISTLLCACTLAGCQYKASTSFSPALDVYSGYKDKIRGAYLLNVTSSQLSGDFRVSGYVCSAHSYSLDLTQAFEGSVMQTIENLIERVDQSEISLDRDTLRSQGYRGLIRVIGEDLEVEITAIPGFWSTEMEAETKLTAAYVVDGREGRLAGGRVYAEGKERHDAGAACCGGAIAVGKSGERALRRLMQQLGERIANEPRLRNSTE